MNKHYPKRSAAEVERRLRVSAFWMAQIRAILSRPPKTPERFMQLPLLELQPNGDYRYGTKPDDAGN